MNYVIANPEKSSQIFEEKDIDKTNIKFNDPNNTTENNDNHEIHDFCLDKFAINYVKKYVISMVTNFKREEVHVDWFGFDINIQSEVESIWISSADDNKNTDYELNDIGGNIEN
ncbi:15697_t:CDS:1 [Funneliformis geosporum]|uniref:15697_t:CDS:1 n=1 Tax=Funneliformis geosporum TaxID=1117311 RepID=A0A9W4WZT6_9GLOM|nr:15697_t:CDS:1 [Funneliformis geosporum]